MKHIIRGIFLGAVMFVLCFIQVFASSEIAFKELNVLPELLEKEGSDIVRRDEFAAVASVVNGGGVPASCETAFTDVNAENPYSGAIRALNEQGILSGVGEGKFAPDEPITYNQVIAVYVKILGYDMVAKDWGGYPTGYIRTAKKFDSFKLGADISEESITYETLWELTDWALESHTASLSYMENADGFDTELSFSETTPTLMQQSLNLEAYTGIVEKYDAKEYSISVEIIESAHSNTYQAGKTATFKASGNINLPELNRAVVRLWVFKNGQICAASLDDDYEIKSGIIYSVNDDETEDAKYQIDKVKEIMIMDDETVYDISKDGLKVYNNGERHLGSLDFAGRFVRMILKDDEISVMETWDFKEGGLINDITHKSLVYTKGDTQLQLNNINAYDSVILFIDGEIRDIKDLKSDCVFDYYENEDETEIVLLVSERKITDTLVSYNNETLKIGYINVGYAEPLYCSSDKTNYHAEDINALFNIKVTGYMDVFGKVRYLCPAGVVENSEFIGYLMGVSVSGFNRDDYQIKIVNLDDIEFKESVFEVSENVRFEEGLTADMVYATAESSTGEGIYRFKKNDNGEIIRIEKLDPFYGFPTGVCEPGSFTESTYNVMTVDGKNLYFASGTKIVGINTKAGEYEFSAFKWSELMGNYCSDITMRFFGEEMSSDVELILLAGDIESIRGSSASHGIVTEVQNILLPDGQDGIILVVNGKEYVMTVEDAEGITENTYIVFHKKEYASGSEIIINDKFALPGDIFSWEGLGSSVVMHRGTVKKVDDRRIFFEDGNIYFFRPNGCQFMKANKKTELSLGSRADSLVGEDVIYSLSSNEVGMVIYQD